MSILPFGSKTPKQLQKIMSEDARYWRGRARKFGGQGNRVAKAKCLEAAAMCETLASSVKPKPTRINE